MSVIKKKVHTIEKTSLQITGIWILILFAAFLLYYNNSNSNQAVSALTAKVYFEGEYRIGDGQWQEIVKGQHIPTTKGDVMLKGNFHLLTPEGEYAGLFDGGVPLAFYADHISMTICEAENDPYMLDHENPLYGISGCGVHWCAYQCVGDSTEPIEILIHNPHSFGNETAVDEFLSNIEIWDNVEFARKVLAGGKIQRNIGVIFALVSLVFFGIALFSTLLHIENNRIIWMLGMTILFAGLYLTYSAPGVSFWSESIIINTTVLGISMMLYMLFLSGIVTVFLRDTRQIGIIITLLLGLVVGGCFLIPILTKIYFYDTWSFWVIAQILANIVFSICLIKDYFTADKKTRLEYAGLAILLISFVIDVIATMFGYWEGGLISSYAFVVLFVAALFLILRIIPENINAAVKATELEIQKSRLEAELKESRISIMLSQIRPHFIYNTLGTIERLCLKDPEKAYELVRNFSLYLRGNFSEIDSMVPISFTEEIKHVEYYVKIEKVRFPDMNIEYKLEITDFVLPALSVQPLVENAIKHGLMRLESGGNIIIRTYETATHICVEVKDDGVGYDTSIPVEEKKHVGIRNIRGRLKTMVNGTLVIESKVGTGTKAVIMIPKE